MVEEVPEDENYQDSQKAGWGWAGWSPGPGRAWANTGKAMVRLRLWNLGIAFVEKEGRRWKTGGSWRFSRGLRNEVFPGKGGGVRRRYR